MLAFMGEYSETHFVHKELLAGDVETPAVKLNRSEHNDFRKKVSEMRAWVEQYGVSAMEVVSLEMNLEAWLVYHICNVDAQIWIASKN
jgi:hemerythrin-like metal-binding protein